MFEKFSLFLLPSLVLLIISIGMIKRVPVYEEFVEGAKDGFKVSISILPYLVALIVAIAMFRASGALGTLATLFSELLNNLGLSADIVPIMLTRSLSGAATLGLFSDLAASQGIDSYTTFVSAVMVGSSETTFYVLSVYFGAIGIKKFRYAILTGLLADIIGIVLAIFVAHYFFLASIV